MKRVLEFESDQRRALTFAVGEAEGVAVVGAVDGSFDGLKVGCRMRRTQPKFVRE